EVRDKDLALPPGPGGGAVRRREPGGDGLGVHQGADGDRANAQGIGDVDTDCHRVAELRGRLREAEPVRSVVGTVDRCDRGEGRVDGNQPFTHFTAPAVEPPTMYFWRYW